MDTRLLRPAAQIQRDEDGLGELVNAFMSYLQGRQPDLNLPVDVQATAFQWQVWEALRAIPSGSTRSYSQVAKTLGHPQAARAVARACATNPVALVIPCHRVVRENGDLGGYRWGIERKKDLLERERLLEKAASGKVPAVKEASAKAASTTNTFCSFFGRRAGQS